MVDSERVKQLDWSKGQQPPAAVLHSLHEPGELSQCFKHQDKDFLMLLLLLLFLNPRYI